MQFVIRLFLCVIMLSFLTMVIGSSVVNQKRGQTVSFLVAEEDWSEESEDDSSNEMEDDYFISGEFALNFNPFLKSFHKDFYFFDVKDPVAEIISPPPQV